MTVVRHLARGSRFLGAPVIVAALGLSLLACSSDYTQSLSPKSAVVFVKSTLSFARSGNGSATFSVEEGTAGGSVTATGIYTPPDTPGVYHVRVQSDSDPSKFAVAAVSVVGQISSPAQAKVGDTVSASVQVPASVTLRWTAANGAIQGSASDSTISVLASSDDVLLGLTASDSGGASAHSSAKVEVFPLPAILTQDFVLARGTGTAVVQNPGARFTYSWSVSGGAILGASTGPSIAYKANGPGPITISCSAVNGAGHSGPAGSTASSAAEFGLQLLAGASSGGGSVDGLGGEARFFFNKHAAGNFAGGGPVYVADWQNCALRKLVKTGTGWMVTTLAGVERECWDLDGSGPSARLNGGSAVAVDSHGSIFLGTYGAIRKVTPDGTVSFFAGQYNAPPAFADGPGPLARFSNAIEAMTIDASDNLYVIDGNAIRKITPGAMVSTLAGNQSISGHADGAGAAATFDSPGGIAVDRSGNVYVAEESNSLVRRIDSGGNVTTYAGKLGVKGSADGSLASAEFAWVRGLAFDADGALLAADCNGIRKITPAGVTTLFRDTADVDQGIAACATDLLVGANGEVLLVEGYNYWLRGVSDAGVMTPVAGSAPLRALVDGPGIASRMVEPSAMAVDPQSGAVYVASPFELGIRKFDPVTGALSTFVADVGAGGGMQRTLALDTAKNLYLADAEGHTIRKITPAGAVSIISTRFVRPQGIAVDGTGNVFVSDTGNGTLWKLSPGGALSLVTGDSDGGTPIDGPRRTARLTNPSGLAIDPAGTLYFCDNTTVRAATPDGTVTTIAGSFFSPGHGDGPGSAATFGYSNPPCGITFDRTGNLLVDDWDNGTIRKLSPSDGGWAVSTLLGTPLLSKLAPGPISSALLSRPQAIGVLPGGDVVIGDGASAALLVMRACGGGAGCSCSADADCGRGYTCGSGLCKQKWALALGGGASMGIASTPDLFPGNDFTLELWVKFSSGSAGTIWSKWTDSLEDKHFHRFSPGLLGYISFTAVGNPNYLFVQFIDPTPEQWHHLAVSNDGTTERIFQDGALVGSLSSASITVRDSAGTLYFGRNRDRLDDVPSPFTIADVRLSSGNRYSGTFVPQAQLTNDAMTRALWHLDAGTGATVPDSSGHGHSATLSGPYGWVADDR